MVQRLFVTYRLAGDQQQSLALARALCVEQTIEFPAELVRKPSILAEVVAVVEEFRPLSPTAGLARLAFNVEIVGGELPQLLNVLFGNASLLPGVRVESFELPPELLARFRGPRFGAGGLRELGRVQERPLLATALKPMGLSAAELAEMAGQLARGGIDLLKDDHGLGDQSYAPFARRVEACARAVARANREAGTSCRYLPHISGPADHFFERARFAREAGAGGVLVAPGLVGWDSLRLLAEDDRFALPILAHPALLGSFVVSPDAGISHQALFGPLHRLAGADAVIYPSHGGRFSFTPAQCRSIAAGCTEPLGGLRPILPVPAGGITLDRVGEMVAFYGGELVLLIGGDLHRPGPDLAANCRVFREAAKRANSSLKEEQR